MNNMAVATRIDVPSTSHFNICGLPAHAFHLVQSRLDKLQASGVATVMPYTGCNDTLHVGVHRGQTNEAVWAAQQILNGLNINYSTIGNVTIPPRPIERWEGYAEMDSREILATEQRLEVIKDKQKIILDSINQANEAAWVIGQMLCQQREILSHNKAGGFNGWLEAELPQISRRQAYNFISVYEMYPNRAKFAQLEVGLSVLYKLAAPSTPESAREEIQERAEQGEKITNDKAAEIIASHKVTIPDSLLWLPERLRKAVVNGHNLSLDHLYALVPLNGLNIIGAPMVATANFDKRTDIPTPAALYNRLFAYSDMTAYEVQAVVARMVAVCKPSVNEVDLSDFTEDDFAEIGAAGGTQPSHANFETGTPGYSYIDGGKQVICDATGEVMSLEQFAIIKEMAESKAAKSKPRKSSGGGGGGGHTRTAEQVHGDALAAGISRGYVAQVERANDPRQFMVRELGKMSEDALNLLAAAIANGEGYVIQSTDNSITIIADFVMKYGVERK